MVAVFTWDTPCLLPRQEAETEAGSHSLVPDALTLSLNQHSSSYSLSPGNCYIKTDWIRMSCIYCTTEGAAPGLLETEPLLVMCLRQQLGLQ